MGLNWRYLAFDVHPDNLRDAIAGAKAMRFIGLNLTVPHKLLALDLVDALDESAKTWGAVNTIRFESRSANGEWKPLREFTGDLPAEVRSHGFNTDADAIIRSLREDLHFEPRGAKVLLLGAGGAGRTAALKLAEESVAELFLVNRTESKAGELAAEMGRRYPGVKTSVGYPRAAVDLALNATSLGLKPGDASPMEEGRLAFNRVRAAYDMIYRPAETEFLRRARAAGCRATNGLGMLLYQGVKALEIWSGIKPPVDVMKRALEQNVYGQ